MESDLDSRYPAFVAVRQDLALSRTLVRRIENHPAFPLQALESVVQVRRCLDEIEARAVEIAREKGATWKDIAEAVGVTRQAIYQKYRNHRENGRGRPLHRGDQ